MPIPRATVEAMSSENKKEYDWKVDGSCRPFLSIVNLTDGEDEFESNNVPSYAPIAGKCQARPNRNIGEKIASSPGKFWPL